MIWGLHWVQKVILYRFGLLLALHDPLQDGKSHDFVLDGDKYNTSQEIHSLRVPQVLIELCISSQQVVDRVFTRVYRLIKFLCALKCAGCPWNILLDLPNDLAHLRFLLAAVIPRQSRLFSMSVPKQLHALSVSIIPDLDQFKEAVIKCTLMRVDVLWRQAKTVAVSLLSNTTLFEFVRQLNSIRKNLVDLLC